MSPEKILLLQIAAGTGIVLGLLGLVTAIVALRKKRVIDRDFRTLTEANDALGGQNADLRAKLDDIRRRAQDLLPIVGLMMTQTVDALRSRDDLQTAIEATMQERDHWHDAYRGLLSESAIGDEGVDEFESTTVVTSAPRPLN